MRKRQAQRSSALTVALLLGLIQGLSWCEAQAQAQIDARNLVPGIVDAPVFDVDGRTRLDAEVLRDKGTDSVYVAMFYVGSEANPSAMHMVASPFPFGSGDRAGYWEIGTPSGLLTVWPFEPGDTVYIQVRVYEMFQGGTIPELSPFIYEWGHSAVLRVGTLASGEPVPLAGLQSFSFEKRRLGISRRSGEVVVEWMRPIGGGYILEAATSLGTMGTWEPVVEESRVPPHDDNLQLVNVTIQVDGRATFYRLRRLWNPPTLNVYSLDFQHDRADPAERVAAHEPPPRALVSDAVGDRTPDSLPAPGSSGGR